MAILKQKIYKIKSGKSILIRSAIKEDAEATLNLKRFSIDERVNELVSPEEFHRTVENEVKWIESQVNNPYHMAIVAVADHVIIGLIDFSNGSRQRISHTGEFGMSVEKKMRGMGVGTLLLQALIDWAKTSGKIEKLQLSVHSTNDCAMGLYKKLGFVNEGLRKNDLKYAPDQYVDTVIMGKIL